MKQQFNVREIENGFIVTKYTDEGEQETWHYDAWSAHTSISAQLKDRAVEETPKASSNLDDEIPF